MSCVENKVEIKVGSRNQFTIALVDDCDRPISLSPYTSGKLVFLNCDGVRTEVDLDAAIPGANPDRGEIPVDMSSTVCLDADDKWKDADLELDDGTSNPIVIPLDDYFDIRKRNAPPV